MVGLLDGIISKFTSAGLATTITGGLYAGDVPETTAMPYAVYHVIIPGFEQAYTGASLTTSEEVGIQFDVVGTSGYRAIGVLCESLATAYRAGVTATSGINYHVNQTSAVFPDADTIGKDQSGNDVWVWHVSFTFAMS